MSKLKDLINCEQRVALESGDTRRLAHLKDCMKEYTGLVQTAYSPNCSVTVEPEVAVKLLEELLTSYNNNCIKVDK